MPRPSRNTDQLLVRAARELLPETGFSRLTLREVAAKAKVNLGMFNYHFKNKQEFVQKVMEQTYEEFLNKFTLQVAAGGTSLERLRKALHAVGRFARDNRKLLTALARDVMEGKRDTVRFIEKNFHRHVKVIIELLRQCQKDGSLDDTISVPMALSFMIASIAGPSVVMSILERAPTGAMLTAIKKSMAPQVISDRALENRIEMAFKAVSKSDHGAGAKADAYKAGAARARTAARLTQGKGNRQ